MLHKTLNLKQSKLESALTEREKLQTLRMREEIKMREEDLLELEESTSKDQRALLEELEVVIEKRQQIESILQGKKQQLSSLEIEFSEIQCFFLEREDNFEDRVRKMEAVKENISAAEARIAELRFKIEQTSKARHKMQTLCEEARKEFDFNKNNLKHKLLARKKTLCRENRVLVERLKMQRNMLEKCQRDDRKLDEALARDRARVKALRSQRAQTETAIEHLDTQRTRLRGADDLARSGARRIELETEE